MRQVAHGYGFNVSSKTNKMICPFHNDSNASLVVYPGDRGYYCYSCNAGGDVIDFVMRLFGIDFKDACRKIDQDFNLHLGVGETRSKEEREVAERAFQERMERKRKHEQRRKLLYAIYHAEYNRYAFLDILKRENMPASFEDEFTPEFVYAIKHLDEAWEQVQEAADRIRQFEAEEK